MKMNLKYFMMLTVLAVGSSEIDAKSTPQTAPSAPTKSTQSAPKLSATQIKDLKDTLSAIKDSEKELTRLQKELPDPKAPQPSHKASADTAKTAKDQQSDPMAKINPKDLASSLSSVGKLKTYLTKLQGQLPAAHKAGQMMDIKQNDVEKALNAIKDVQDHGKIVQNILSRSTSDKNLVIIQPTTVEYAVILALIVIVCLGAINSLYKQLEKSIDSLTTTSASTITPVGYSS